MTHVLWLKNILISVRTVSYTHLDVYKRQLYRRKHKNLIELDSVPEKKDENDIEKSVISSEVSMKTHEILHNLSEPYKEVFSLRVFGELSFRQIGSLFGKTDNWACVTFQRARNKIREEMRDY